MRKIAGLFAAALLAAASPAFATNGMRMIGFGPVQNSMGGAGVAAPLDAATVISNPAGLSALQRRADLAGTFFNPSVKYASDAGSGNSVSSDRSPSYIPTLGVVAPMSDALHVGIAAFGVSGMGVDYGRDLFGSTTMTSYMNMRVAPAASYQLAKGVSVGLAANLMYAQMKYAVGDAMGILPRDTQGSFGYGATVGLQYAPVDMVTLGVAYESKSFFQDFEWNLPTGKDKLDFDQPQVATVGAAMRPLPGLLVAADVEWINWSDTNGKGQPKFKTAGADAMPWNLNWDDQIVLKLGGEYAATPALKVRAGYNYGKMPLDKSRVFENVAFPAIAEHHITAGAGYSLGALTVNVAAMYVPEAKISGSDPDFMGMGMPVSYTTKMSQLAFDLGASYRF
jgi:long-chain fatty acid transport protein